jgi:flavin reductase (DIM6/NTAB) family NADH-FMN oxidoreductase RutF
MIASAADAASPVPGSESETASDVFDPRAFRSALGCYPTGVAVITAAAADGRRAGLTVNSFASVSLNPPLILWSLFLHSRSMPIFQEASHHCINVLSEAQGALAQHFAQPADNKFEGIAWHAGLGGAPVLEGAIAHFQCRNSDRHYAGDHVIFLGAVEQHHHTAGEPLLFSRGVFRTFPGNL